MPPSRPPLRSTRAQATVEFLGVLPFALLVLLVVAQCGLGGWAWWSASAAARVGARAAAVSGESSAAPAARRALPASLRRHSSVVFSRTGAVHVRVRVPVLLPLAPGALGAVRGEASFEPQGAGS